MTEPKLETFAEIAGWLKAAPVGGKVKVVPETGEAPGIIKRDKTGWYWDDSGTPFSLHNVYIAATFQRIEENPQMTGNPTSLVAMLTRGMSLRDWFAGKALAVLTKEVCWLDTRGASDRAQRIADAAYLMADAMLKAREGE